MTEINLFELLTLKESQMLRQGGTYAQILNANEDGVVYLKVDTAEIVNETLSNQS